MTGLKAKITKNLARLDAWVNEITGLGSVRDKIAGYQLQRRAPLTYYELTTLYDDDATAEEIVSKRIRDALKHGFNIVSSSEEIDEAQKKEYAIQINDKLKKLKAKQKIREAAIWGDTYGHAILFLGLDTGETMDKPAELENIREIRFLYPMDPRDYTISEFEKDTNSEDFREPKYYQMNSSDYGSLYLHASRTIAFEGRLTSYRSKQLNNNHAYSILHAVFPSLRSLNSAFQASTAMMSDSSIAIMKIKGFYEGLAGPLAESLKTRVEIVDLFKSVSRMIPLDAEDEDFEFRERSFTGVSDVLSKHMLKVCADSDYPATVLFGKSAEGMNATGEHDTLDYYDSVQVYREEELEPAINEVVQIVAHVLEIPDPESWGISWPSLYQMTPSQTADHQLKVAQTDQIYMDKEVVYPEEYAIERFGGEEYSDKAPQIDAEKRKALLESEIIGGAFNQMGELLAEYIEQNGLPSNVIESIKAALSPGKEPESTPIEPEPTDDPAEIDPEPVE